MLQVKVPTNKFSMQCQLNTHQKQVVYFGFVIWFIAIYLTYLREHHLSQEQRTSPLCVQSFLLNLHFTR